MLMFVQRPKICMSMCRIETTRAIGGRTIIVQLLSLLIDQFWEQAVVCHFSRLWRRDEVQEPKRLAGIQTVCIGINCRRKEKHLHSGCDLAKWANDVNSHII
jgi:hypothetical protein